MKNLTSFVWVLLVGCCVLGCLKEDVYTSQEKTYETRYVVVNPDAKYDIDFFSRFGIVPAAFYAYGSGTFHNAFVSTRRIEEAIKLTDVDSTVFVKVSPSHAAYDGYEIANFDIIWFKKDGTKMYAYNILSKYNGTNTHTIYYRNGLLHQNHPYAKVSFKRTEKLEPGVLALRGETGVRLQVWETRFHKTLQDTGKVVEVYRKDPYTANTKQFGLVHYFN